ATLLPEKGERRRHSARGLREIPPAEGTPEGVSPLLWPAARGAAGLRTGDGDRELRARTGKNSAPAGAHENGSPALPSGNYNDIKITGEPTLGTGWSLSAALAVVAVCDRPPLRK